MGLFIFLTGTVKVYACEAVPLFSKEGSYTLCHTIDPSGSNGIKERFEKISLEECEQYCSARQKTLPPLSSEGTQELKASDILANLQTGNDHFVNGELTHPRQDSSTRMKLAKEQRPGTVIVTCSDSRLSPEITFDQGLGDLFQVRTAGHTLSHASIGSIEYAVEL